MAISTRSTLLGGSVALIAGTALALASPLAASAHVHAHATSTAAGSSTVVSFLVPHGCDGSPTLTVTIDIPDGALAVSPYANAAWTIETVLEEGASDDAAVAPRVEQVVYTSTTGGLVDGVRDVLDVSLMLPDGAVGDVIAFPTTQTCVEGTAAWEGADAPSVTLTAAAEDESDHGHGAAEPEAEHTDGAEVGAHTEAQPDVLARVLGIAGLVVGAAGLIAAFVARRSIRS